MNRDDVAKDGHEISGKFFRELTGALNPTDQAQLRYVNLARPLVLPTGSLIGIYTMSSRNRDCHSEKDLTAVPSHRSWLQSLYTWEEDTNQPSLVLRAS